MKEILISIFFLSLFSPQPGDADYPAPSPCKRHTKKVEAIRQGNYDQINTDLMPDLIHPNASGAEAWVSAIEPLLSKLIGEN